MQTNPKTSRSQFFRSSESSILKEFRRLSNQEQKCFRIHIHRDIEAFARQKLDCFPVWPADGDFYRKKADKEQNKIKAGHLLSKQILLHQKVSNVSTKYTPTLRNFASLSKIEIGFVHTAKIASRFVCVCFISFYFGVFNA